MFVYHLRRLVKIRYCLFVWFFFSTENETNREVAIRQFLQGRCLIFSVWTNQRKVGVGFLDNPFVSCFQLSMEKWHMSDCVPGSIWQSETWKGECGQGCNQKRDSLDRVTLKVIFALLTGEGGGWLTIDHHWDRSFRCGSRPVVSPQRVIVPLRPHICFLQMSKIIIWGRIGFMELAMV